MTKAVLGATLAATALTAAAPADAQRYRRGYRHDDGAGTAIIAGVAGLAIGAAIASNNNRDRYYRDDYYNSNDNYRYDDYNHYPRYNNYYYRDRVLSRAAASSAATIRITGAASRVRVCY